VKRLSFEILDIPARTGGADKTLISRKRKTTKKTAESLLKFLIQAPEQIPGRFIGFLGPTTSD
jgi:hypothetical protein